MTSEPVFLSLDQALRIHARMIELFGGAERRAQHGAAGVRTRATRRDFRRGVFAEGHTRHGRGVSLRHHEESSIS